MQAKLIPFMKLKDQIVSELQWISCSWKEKKVSLFNLLQLILGGRIIILILLTPPVTLILRSKSREP